jgi:hypothetical protein
MGACFVLFALRVRWNPEDRGRTELRSRICAPPVFKESRADILVYVLQLDSTFSCSVLHAEEFLRAKRQQKFVFGTVVAKAQRFP